MMLGVSRESRFCCPTGAAIETQSVPQKLAAAARSLMSCAGDNVIGTCIRYSKGELSGSNLCLLNTSSIRHFSKTTAPPALLRCPKSTSLVPNMACAILLDKFVRQERSCAVAERMALRG